MRRDGRRGGGLIVNIFLGSEIFSSGVQIFSGGVEKISEVGAGLRNFFLGGGLRNFRGGFEKFSGGGLKIFFLGGGVGKF